MKRKLDQETPSPVQKERKLHVNTINDQKKLLDRKILKLQTKCPKFILGTNGKESDLRLPEITRIPLTPQHIQELIFCALFESWNLPAIKTWFLYKQSKLMKCLSIVIVEGLDLAVIRRLYEETGNEQVQNDKERVIAVLPRIGCKQLCQVEILPPHQQYRDILDEVMRVHIGKSYLMKAVVKIHKGENPNIKILPKSEGLVNTEKKEKVNRTKLLMTQSMMKKANYPLPGKREDFVPSKSSYVPVTRHSPLFAIDCEQMKEKLAVVTLVNEENEVIYYKVLDWCVSGLIPNRSEANPDYDYAAELREVHKDLDELLPLDAILVGHGLESDLKLLKMYHPYCIDTAVSYALRRTNTPSLIVLAKIFLWENIQGKMETHDPIEDAKASLALVKLKLSKSRNYGNVYQGGNIETSIRQLAELEKVEASSITQLYEALARTGLPKKSSFELCELIPKYYGELNLATTTELSEERHMYKTANEKVKLHLGKTVKKVFKESRRLIATKPVVFTHVKVTDPDSVKILDKQLDKLHEAAPECSLHVTVFTGEHGTQQSNGCVMVSTKNTKEIEALKLQRKDLNRTERISS